MRMTAERDFAVGVTVLNSFVGEPRRTLFGLPIAHAPVHPTYDPPDRRVLEQRFSDRFSAISLGLLVASQQGGALWIDELDEPAPAETSRVVYH